MRILAFCSATKRYSRRVLAISLLAAISLVIRNQPWSYAEQGLDNSSDQKSRQSTVFVVDVSTSMYDIMDNLKSAFKGYVRELKPGDSIAIVTFGRSAELLYRRTVRGDSDIERVLKFCDGLSCPDEYTYIACGLDAGVKEVLRYCRENPFGQHQLVLMSDGVNNPPDGLDEEITFEDLEKKYFAKFEPGRDWFISYFALKGIKDRNLAEFVEKWGGVQKNAGEKLDWISQVKIDPGIPTQDNVITLGSACLPIDMKIPLYISPIKGRPEGMAIEVEPFFTNLTVAGQLIARVDFSKIVCGATRMKEEISLFIDGTWDSGIEGVLRLAPADDSFLLVYPTQIRFRFEKPPRVTIDSIQSLDLGPLEPGGEPGTARLRLKLDGLVPQKGLTIHAEPVIDLPNGITCDADLSLTDFVNKEAYVIVKGWATSGAPAGAEWIGQLVLSSPGCETLFSNEFVPLRIFTPLPKEEFPWKWIVFGMLSSFLVLTLGLLGQKAYKKKFVPAEGWLIALEKPDGASFQNVDLKVLSEKLQKSSLILGSASTTDIPVLHEAVGKRHAQIRSRRKKGKTTVHMESLDLSDIKVNTALIDEEVELKDRDIIEIGDFQFLYSNSHLKQVVVHYKDGDVKYGVPLTWSIEDEGFVIRPEGEGADDLQMYIPFKDLKAVFFVKDFDKEIARKMDLSNIYAKKDHVVVRFRDGERIEGYTIQNYDPKAPRFFMVPKRETGKEENNIFILVERRFTREVKTLGKRG